MTKAQEDRIVAEIGNCFQTFGGGRTITDAIGNPLSEALRSRPPMFALGVDVRSVVQFIGKAMKKPTARRKR